MTSFSTFSYLEFSFCHKNEHDISVTYTSIALFLAG
jgi:hypothetical protein